MYLTDKTTITLNKETRQKLEEIKEYPRETVDETINRLLNYYHHGDDEGEYTEEFKKRLTEADKQIKNKQTISLDNLAKKHRL